MQEAVNPQVLTAKLQPLANRYLIDWYETKARVYLRIINRLISSSRLPLVVKRPEISRLFHLRQECLEMIEKLNSADLKT